MTGVTEGSDDGDRLQSRAASDCGPGEAVTTQGEGIMRHE
jgi:hypothetical protein